MARLILRYTQAPAAPAGHVESILATEGLNVIDRSPSMLLVDVDEATVREKLASLPGWSVHPEQSVPLPDTRRTIA